MAFGKRSWAVVGLIVVVVLVAIAGFALLGRGRPASQPSPTAVAAANGQPAAGNSPLATFNSPVPTAAPALNAPAIGPASPQLASRQGVTTSAHLAPAATSVHVPPVPTMPPARDVYNLGQAGRVGDLVVTVKSAASPVTATVKPAVGRKFIVLDVDILNLTMQAVSVAPGQQLVLKDSAGGSYNVDPGATAAGNGLVETERRVASGELVHGIFGFTVPQSASGLRLEFTSDKGVTSVFAAG